MLSMVALSLCSAYCRACSGVIRVLCICGAWRSRRRNVVAVLSQPRRALKCTCPQPQLGGRPEKPKARAPNGWPDRETLVRQHFLRWICLSGSNEEGLVRCASAKRMPAHAMSRMPPMKRISCSGADPLQIHRSHCTSTAKGNGNASRPAPGIAAPEM